MSSRFRCLGEFPATQSISSFLKGQAPHRVPTGRTYQVLFISRAWPNLLFEVQVYTPRRQRFQTTSRKPSSLNASRKSVFKKKENHHV